MTAILVYLAIVGSVIGIYLSRQRLFAKPWLEAGPAGVLPGTGPSPMSPAALAVWIIIAVAGALFTLFVSAWLMRRHMGQDWQDHLPLPYILWLTTVLLAADSLALHDAQRAAGQGARGRMLGAVGAAWLLALLFLAGQAQAWRTMTGEGMGLAANPAASFFYLLTGAHALHLAGGMIGLGIVTVRALRDDPRLAREPLSLCATYWHFLLVAWLVLFGLMLHG